MLDGQKKVVILWNTDTLINVTLKVLISNYTRRGPCHVEKEVNFSKISILLPSFFWDIT
jgi:hypothetical protein